MQAVILSIGDELIIGDIVDTNAAYISRQMIKYGVMPAYKETLPDQKEKIVSSIQRASNAAEIVIITGGLGPTEDDLTRYAIAEAAGVELFLNKEVMEQLEKWFIARNRKMSESNRRQALFPLGAEALSNPIGTAAGIKMKIKDALVIALPGVPKELYAMFDIHIAPLLKKLAAQKQLFIRTGILHCFGTGESVVGEKLKDLMEKRDGDVVVGTNVSGGVISVKIRITATCQSAADEKMRTLKEEIKHRLGDDLFGEDDQTLPSIVASLLKQKQKTLAVAESCTGGLLGGALTEIPGASVFFVGGMIVYSNKLKNEWLNVPEKILQEYGAVSAATVNALATNLIRKTGADYSLAISGIAGPEGGTLHKPVGTVWIALGKKLKDKNIVSNAECFSLFGDRTMIRDRAVKCALDMLRRELISLK